MWAVPMWAVPMWALPMWAVPMWAVPMWAVPMWAGTFSKKRVLENGQSLIPKPWAIPNSGACLELIYESGPPP